MGKKEEAVGRFAVLALALLLYFVPFFVAADIEASTPEACRKLWPGLLGCPYDWQQMWGGAITLVAAALAYYAVRQQIAAQRANEASARSIELEQTRAALIGSLQIVDSAIRYRITLCAFEIRDLRSGKGAERLEPEHRSLPIPKMVSSHHSEVAALGASVVRAVASLHAILTEANINLRVKDQVLELLAQQRELNKHLHATKDPEIDAKLNDTWERVMLFLVGVRRSIKPVFEALDAHDMWSEVGLEDIADKYFEELREKHASQPPEVPGT